MFFIVRFWFFFVSGLNPFLLAQTYTLEEFCIFLCSIRHNATINYNHNIWRHQCSSRCISILKYFVGIYPFIVRLLYISGEEAFTKNHPALHNSGHTYGDAVCHWSDAYRRWRCSEAVSGSLREQATDPRAHHAVYLRQDEQSHQLWDIYYLFICSPYSSGIRLFS